ncbi:MAG: thioredoxin domain-containing protein [Sphingobacteriales bacterium]|nr:MAG: thioredoxin domain-containing protein [Sphingobacteriales bacterium]
MNRLASETSPYLLQHAHNPVDWYPWGEEALLLAKKLDKPILVSIGYSACHWCHVMERESFEDPATAAFMNEAFVNVKIDREERPDLDHIYMDAVQAMSGSGGWPLNVFLTPEAKPFYGGTYFPPARVHNRPSWMEVLSGISRAFREDRDKIEEQAQQLTDHLSQQNQFGTNALQVNILQEERFNYTQLHQAFDAAMGQADKLSGGFGKAPKFPQTFTINYLLRYHFLTGTQEALDQALLSLDKMIQGGIYDHLGGGFARYSTDTEWLAPHFEKMLYDNALLVLSLCEAFQVTANPVYEKIIRQTLGFVIDELMDEEGGFYSALDADSEGEEGKFYTWSLAEVMDVLGEEDGPWFAEIYDVTEKGNWEHVNILRVRDEERWKVEVGSMKWEKCRKALMARRGGRVRPGLDDKILTSWNALMNLAFSSAATVLNDAQIRQVAEKNMAFLWSYREKAGEWRHNYKKGEYKVAAFLDDQAYLIWAMTGLYEMGGDEIWLNRAKAMMDEVSAAYSDEESRFYYYTQKGQEDVIVRKKEIYDGATPSGNAVMALNGWKLGVLTGNESWKNRSRDMVDAVLQVATRYPTSFGVWSSLLAELATGTFEIGILGPGADEKRKQLLLKYLPFKVVQSAENNREDLPLLMGKNSGADALVYLCRDYVCKKPVESIEELFQLIESELPGKSDTAQ